MSQCLEATYGTHTHTHTHNHTYTHTHTQTRARAHTHTHTHTHKSPKPQFCKTTTKIILQRGGMGDIETNDQLQSSKFLDPTTGGLMFSTDNTFPILATGKTRKVSKLLG